MVSAAAAASPVPPSPSSTNTRGISPCSTFDLYRLGSSDELFDIGWEDYLARGGVCAVEWSERAEDAFDGSTVRIDFRRSAQHDGWRVITITGVDGL